MEGLRSSPESGARTTACLASREVGDPQHRFPDRFSRRAVIFSAPTSAVRIKRPWRTLDSPVQSAGWMSFGDMQPEEVGPTGILPLADVCQADEWFVLGFVRAGGFAGFSRGLKRA